ncbi:hypothetical protein K443DRAFT_7427, partial [Laccaria amethystina LaAM-08-1]
MTPPLSCEPSSVLGFVASAMPVPVFDVFGRDGEPGVAGIDRGHTTAAKGQNGRGGGHGSPGRAGTAAGIIALWLSTPKSTTLLPHNVVLPEPAEADVSIKGSFTFSDRTSQRLDTILNVDAGELIVLRAKGGNGGRGGDGGGGQDGGVGIRCFLHLNQPFWFLIVARYRGEDATRYSSGSDGGPGGNGGDGGDAGAGGGGQSGGVIQLSVSQEDTYLLMICGGVDISGGTGGLQGKPGEGGAFFSSGNIATMFLLIDLSYSGSGGRGGQGGSSYTYATTRDGKTTWHMNHGGSRGRDGWPGSRGAYALPGTNGPAGVFSITVADGITNSTYGSPYNLQLQDVTLLSEKEDGVFEPGSRVFVSSIEVLNTGGMPTPTTRSVLAYIKPEEIQQPTLNGKNWVISEGLGRFVQLPPALEPNNPVTVPCSSLTRGIDKIISAAVNSTGEYLAFRVAPINPVVVLSSCSNRHERGAPFRVTTPLVIRAQMTPFGRDFTHFVRDVPFNVSYPVQLSEVASLSALPPG